MVDRKVNTREEVGAHESARSGTPWRCELYLTHLVHCTNGDENASPRINVAV